MNVFELVNNNIRLAILSFRSANTYAALIQAGERNEAVREAARMTALLSGFIGGDDGINREATG